jgi:glycogen(starch) synthase
MAHAFVELGHQCTVVLCGRFPMFGDSDGNVRLQQLSPRGFWGTLPAPLGRGPSLWFGRELARLATALQMDVVEAPDCGGWSALFDLFKPAHVLSVVRLHTSTTVLRLADNLTKNRLAEWLEKRAIVSADLVTANSFATIEHTRTALNLTRADIRVLPNPVAPAFFALPPVEAVGDPMVVFHGRLQWAKGADIFARAISGILQQHPTARFRFIGEDSRTALDGGSMLAHVRALLPPESVAKVDFTTYVEPDEVPARLADAAVCVFPSRWDGFGIACAEAMAAHKAVVASQRLAELVQHGRTGLCVPNEDPEALAQAVCLLLSDRELRQRLGAAAREYASRILHPLEVAKSALDVYTGALAARQAKAQAAGVTA